MTNQSQQPKEKWVEGWNEEASYYKCSDGVHNSWWQSIARTEQWDQWYAHASKNMLYDVDECLECGWMSEGHAKDFMKFIVDQARQEGAQESQEMITKLKNALLQMCEERVEEIRVRVEELKNKRESL